MSNSYPASPSIVPHLWFDTQAVEAARFYTSVFPDSALDHVGQVRGTPSGDCDIVSFRLGGQPFMAISAGPHFRFNPSISFMVNFDPSRMPDARDRLDAAWARLAEGGKALMPLDAYPFSPRYGWIQDRYGLSWQLILTNPQGAHRPFLAPALLFTGEACGQAEAAGAFYRSVFSDSEPGQLVRYPAGMEPNREGTVMFSDFRLGDTWFAALDGGIDHGFRFNEAISFVVNCRGQAELDGYWEKLSAVPEAEMCGWLKDRFGLSWQLQPAEMNAMMRSGDQPRIDRLTRAFLTMKKLDLAALRAAYDGTPQSQPEPITVAARVDADVARVWHAYTTPEHITQWNFATPEWHCPSAAVDLRPGGRFSARMEARDGSAGFDFEGTYVEVARHQRLRYTFGGREAEVIFRPEAGATTVTVTFTPETTFPLDHQRAGWQSILDQFKRYVESAS